MKSRNLYLIFSFILLSKNCFPQSFQITGTSLPNLNNGEVVWGDYDNDGDLDILITGWDQFYNSYSRVYQNTGGGNFVYQSGISLTGAGGGTSDWVDYDNDGDLDIMISGSTGSGNIAKIWRNNGGNSFSEQTSISFAGVTYISSVAWGDYNNDGDPDVIITGQDEKYKYFFKLYRNNGNDTFTEQTGISFTGMSVSSVVWGDYDNDSDLDILLTGYLSGSVSRIYRNNADNTFTEQSNISLKGVTNGIVAWTDYDNDGDLDIFTAGDSGSGKISKVYRNNNNNTFTEQTSILITGVSDGSAAWGDYDNDGDPDLLITGEDANSNRISRIYKNNGNDTFTEQAGITLQGVSRSSVAWGDYDNDGDLDIIMTGFNSSWNPATLLYQNIGGPVNTKPVTPANLSQSVSGNSANLSWNRSTDTQTPQSGLFYNLYVSTSPSGSNVKSPNAIIATGYRKIVENCEIKDNKYVIKNLSAGTYYWSVQAVDAAYAGSAFAGQGNFTISFSNSISPVEEQFLAPGKTGIPITVSETLTADSRQWKYSVVPGGPYDKVLTGETSVTYSPMLNQDNIMYVVCVSTKSGISVISNEVKIELFQFDEQTTIAFPGTSNGSLAWGDYDKDGDLDILICGTDNNSARVSKIYRNNGNNSFTEQTGISLPGVINGSSNWVDYDNNGYLDIFITGQENSTAVSRLYKNNGNNTFSVQTGIVFTGAYYSSSCWGDFNNDGFQDLLLTGRDQSNVRLTKIYKNNGNNSFSEQTGISITAVDMGDCSWSDYDIDGDLDILVTGYSASGSVAKIFKNNGNSTFSEQTGIILQGVYYSSASWGDFNSDKYPDILLSGYSSVTGLRYSKVYQNNSGTAFTEQSGIQLTGVNLGSVEWGDYDNDGDLDILLSGYSSSGVAVSEIYRNNGGANFIKQKSSSFSGVYYSRLSWADYDNDKDLDIILSGYTGTTRMTKIYQNICEISNTAPKTPNDLVVTVIGANMKLSWNSSSDKETSSSGLSYNLRIGTSPGSSDIKSAESNSVSGYHYLVNRGNAGQTDSWTIRSLPPGTYYWSVQAIDNGYLSSEFAPEAIFENYYAESGINYSGKDKPYFGDYDRDGDLDILADNNTMATIFRNDLSTGSGFTDMTSGLTKLGDAELAWGDYDNDGDLDIAQNGYNGNFYTKIYRNDNGIFTEIATGMQGTWMGTLAWGDYDNDGDLDLFVYGNHERSDDGEPIGILYRNDGNDKFTDSGIDIEDARRGSVAIADYNGDGYVDILTCGYNLSQNIFTSILRNNWNNSFTKINAEIPGYSYGDLCWGDYDSDGDLDIFITGGLYGGEGSTRIYQNQGDESFKDIGMIFPGSTTSYSNMVEWGDYDNDGDLDILLPVKNCIIRNDGNNNFTAVDLGFEIYSGTWGDIDNDGDLDIVTSSAILLNKITNTNTAPGIPNGLQSKVAGNRVTLSWNKSTDDSTPVNAITYNVCVGTSAGDWNILSPMVDNISGYKKSVPGMGNAVTNNFKILKELPIGTYYWAVQAVDNGFMTSSFSPVQSFEILPMFINVKSLSIYNSLWGDCDNDGDLDFLERKYPKMSVFRNDGSDFFVETSINITYEYVNEYYAWGDYDNDGDLDIITSDSIFRNDLNNTFTNTGIHFVSPLHEIIPGDYDADGDLDILASISEDGKSIIYRNEKNNIFTLIDLPLDPGYYGSLNWFDYDNDGDLDITIVDGDYGYTKSQIYRNDGENDFTNINAGLTGLMYCSISFADYDNDKDLDIMLIGRDNDYNNQTKIFRNDGDDIFTDTNANIRGYYGYSDPPGAFWGDHNNDGFIDVIISGNNNGRIRNKLYLNNKDGSFTEMAVDNIVEYNEVYDVADYDNDGDLDAITNDGVFRNNTNPANVTPKVVTNLNSDLKGLNCLLSWDRSMDSKGDGYSYNIRIGTSSGSCNTKSPKSPPGFGNVPCDTSWLIRGLAPGRYYWSVQAVNQTYSSGPWAPEKSFVITNVSPDFSANTVCFGSNTVFTDLSVTSDVIIKWKWDFGDGGVSDQRHPVHLYNKADTFNVSLRAYSQSGDSAERVRPVIVKPSPDASFSVTPVCKDQPSLLQNQSDVKDITVSSWLWDFGNGEFSSSRNSVEKTYIRSDTAILKIIAENGCHDADTQLVVVAEYPLATISLSPGYSNIFCSGDSTILNVPHNDKYDYQWKLNGIDIFGESKSAVKVKGPAGDYSVDVTNPVAGCISGSNIRVTVNKAPARPSIDSGDYYRGKCLGGTPVILSVDDVAAGYNYRWYRNGSPVGDSTFIEVFEEGNYYLEANLGNCTSDTVSLTVEFMKSLQKPVIVVRGPTVWYLTTSSTAKYYRWYYNGSHLSLADNSKVYIAGQNLGIYRVSVSDDNQCYAFSDTVRIPKGTVGIEDPDPINDVKIYPNPTTGMFTIEMDNNIFGELIIDIYTPTGSKALNIKFKKTTEHFSSQIDLSGQSKGMYMINMAIEKYETSRKILIE